jgi:hypothetical protein
MIEYKAERRTQETSYISHTRASDEAGGFSFRVLQRVLDSFIFISSYLSRIPVDIRNAGLVRNADYEIR